MVTASPSRLRRAAADAGVSDLRVLQAIDEVRRADFLPPEQVPLADIDEALRLPHGQTTSQPSLVAQMIQALRVDAGSRVLEVGTGHGYEAALLARIVREVWTVEVVAELAETARAILASHHVDSVHVVCGDGRLGLPEHAPYDGIIVAAQCERVPTSLVDQLAVGGRLVAPVGDSYAQRCLVLERRGDGTVRAVGDLGGVRFVPLV